MVDEQRLAALAKAGGGWVETTNAHFAALVEAGLAEVTDGPDRDGDVFVTITDSGSKWLEASSRGERPKVRLVEETTPLPEDAPQPEIEQTEPVGGTVVMPTTLTDPLQALAAAPERKPQPKEMTPLDVRVGVMRQAVQEEAQRATRRNGVEKLAEAPRGRRGRVVSPEPEKADERSALCPVVAAEWDVEPAEWNRPPVRKRFGPTTSPITRALRLDELPVGASIHIAATPEAPHPHRKYAHHVVAANRKWARRVLDAGGNPMLRPKGKRMIPLLEYERRYRIFKTAEDDPRGPGARIQRVDPNEDRGED